MHEARLTVPSRAPRIAALGALVASLALHSAALLSPWPGGGGAQPPRVAPAVIVALAPPVPHAPPAADAQPAARSAERPTPAPASRAATPARPRSPAQRTASADGALARPIEAVPPAVAPATPPAWANAADGDTGAAADAPAAADAAALAQAPPAPDDAQPSGEGASAAAPAPAVADPAVALALPPAATARLPERIELGFDAYLESVAGDTRIGTARFELRLDGERYRMTIDARGPLATLAFGSEGVFAGDGFRPERFAERRRVAFRPMVDRGVRYVRAGDAPAAVDEASLAVPPGAQDRLSALFQLWLVARAAPAFPAPGTEIPMPLATISKVHAARFRVSEPEPFEVDGRGVGAVRFTMVRDGGEPTIDVWLADDEARLPLVLRYAERGQAVRFVATGAR